MRGGLFKFQHHTLSQLPIFHKAFKAMQAPPLKGKLKKSLALSGPVFYEVFFVYFRDKFQTFRR